jgi:hypothetical protein
MSVQRRVRPAALGGSPPQGYSDVLGDANQSSHDGKVPEGGVSNTAKQVRVVEEFQLAHDPVNPPALNDASWRLVRTPGNGTMAASLRVLIGSSSLE